MTERQGKTETDRDIQMRDKQGKTQRDRARKRD